MFCYHCGKKVPENAKFCPECGTPCGKNEIFSQETAPVDESLLRDLPPMPPEPQAARPPEPPSEPPKKRIPMRQLALPFAAGAVLMLLLVVLVSGMGKAGGNAPAASAPAQSEPAPEPPEVNPLGEAPDLQAFSGGKLAVLDQQAGVGHTEITYAADWNKKFFKEYVSLLQDEYGFARREYRYDEEQDSYLYSFDFIGSADVGTFLGGRELNDPADISFSVWGVFSDDARCEIRIAYADGVRYEDTGDRTTQELDDLSEAGEETLGKGSWFEYLLAGKLKDYCFTCQGVHELPCTRCGGKGGAYATEGDAPDGLWVECGLCGGTGRIPCPDCKDRDSEEADAPDDEPDNKKDDRKKDNGWNISTDNWIVNTNSDNSEENTDSNNRRSDTYSEENTNSNKKDKKYKEQ